MNWRRGLIRLWLVGSMLWAVPVGWFTWSSDNVSWVEYHYYTITHPEVLAEASTRLDAALEHVRALDAVKAKIRAAHGLEAPLPELPIDPSNSCKKEFQGQATAAECEELRRAINTDSYPPSSPQLQRFLTLGDGSVEPLLQWLPFVIGPPIFVLIVGASLLWALHGFRRA